MTWFVEVSLADFVLVSILIGGGIAWMTGRALALNWYGLIRVTLACLALAVVVRWVHFALFGGTFLSLYYYLIDLAVLLVSACTSFLVTRKVQMKRQYGFL